MSVPFKQVQSKGGGAASNASTLGVTWTNNTTSGNLILVVVSTGSQAFCIVSSITDSQGNTYSNVDAGANTIDGELWYAKNIAGGTTPTVTVTWSGTGQVVAVLIAEYSGLNLTKPLNAHTKSTGSSGTTSSGASAVTDQATELVIGWGAIQSASPSYVAGSGYGNLITQSQTSVSVAIEDQTVTSMGAQTATFTNTSTLWIGGVATFMTGNNVQASRLRPHAFSPGLAR